MLNVFVFLHTIIVFLLKFDRLDMKSQESKSDSFHSLRYFAEDIFKCII